MRSGILVIIVTACLLGVPACASEPMGERFIRVQASGWVYAVPDTLTLNVSARFTEESMEKARSAADRVVASVTELARAAGIDAEDIDSSQLSAFPEYQWKDQNRVYLGETVERRVTLTVRDLDKYGALIGKLSKLALHRIDPPTLSHSKQQQLELDAIRHALQQGRTKALAIADEVDAKLGPVLSVQENQGQRIQPRMMMAEANVRGGSEPGFSFARQRIEATVEMRFALQ
jgi:uncharacterized protein YggE